MKKYFLIIIICFSYLNLFSEKKPKLVVGIVVDQMRFDFIERFWNDFGNNGFKKTYKTGTFL